MSYGQTNENFYWDASHGLIWNSQAIFPKQARHISAQCSFKSMLRVDLGREAKIHLPLPQQTADFQSQDSVDHNHCACVTSSAQLPLRTDLNPTIEIPNKLCRTYRTCLIADICRYNNPNSIIEFLWPSNTFVFNQNSLFWLWDTGVVLRILLFLYLLPFHFFKLSLPIL